MLIQGLHQYKAPDTCLLNGLVARCMSFDLLGRDQNAVAVLNHNLLFDVRVLVLAVEGSHGKADVLEFRVSYFRLHLLHIERPMNKLEVLEKRMRTDERLEVE